MPFLLGILALLVRIGALLRWLFVFIKGKAFVTALLFYLFSYMGGIIGRFFKVLGVTLIVNEFATPHFTDIIAGSFLGLPPEWVAFIGMVKLDQAITIILSAIAFRMVDQVQVARRKDPGGWVT